MRVTTPTNRQVQIMKEDVKILISATPGPKFHLYREAIKRSKAVVCDGYLPKYDQSFDGLLLAGGCDVSPELYGETINGANIIDHLRDECEMELIRQFSDARKPIFGICRGMQILNVYFGGTLIQDLPKEPMHHSDYIKIFHPIKTKENSLIRSLLGNEFISNSFHHEAVKDIADGFKITAVSHGDNVVEAIEHTSMPFFGVQFHPERMTPKIPEAADAKPIFDYFISLCKQNNN